MLDRVKIIRQSLLMVGETFGVINSNRTEITNTADELLESVEAYYGTNTNTLFNTRKVLASKLGEREFNGVKEYMYGMPSNFLGITSTNSPYVIEGEHIVSEDEELQITYCYAMDLIEYPAYMNGLVTVALAIALAEAIDTYSSSLTYLYKRLTREIQMVSTLEGIGSVKYVTVDK